MDAPAPVPVLEPVLPRRARRLRRVPRAVTTVAVPAAGLALGCVLLLGDTTPGTVPGRLAFVDPDGRLATSDERGADVVRHDVSGVRFEFPAWSPDGSRIAAIGANANEGGVYVVAPSAAGSAPEAIYASSDRAPFYLSWSPDGERISFLTSEPDGIALRVVPADGSTAAEVVHRAAPLYWDWVDPARLLLHTGSSGPDAFVGEVDLAGTVLEADAIAAGFFRAPAVSREGRVRAFVGPTADGRQAIVIEARDGSARHEIPVDGSVAIGFDPTATMLAFIATDRPTIEPAPLPVGPLRLVDASSGSVRSLVDGPVVAFFWSPDGRTIVALELAGSGSGVDEAIGGPRIAGVRAAAVPPPGLPVRLRFVDAASATIGTELDVRVTERFAFQLLPFFDQYALSHRFWSADSSSVVLPLVAEDGGDVLTVVPADGSEPRHVAEGSMASWSP